MGIWGTLPEWLSGVATAGALFFAFAGWRIAVIERHEAAAAARAQAERERRAHAQQFVCSTGGGSSTAEGDVIRWGVRVNVLNHSPHTFLNVEVHATAHGPDGWVETGVVQWPQLTPSPEAVQQHKTAYVWHKDDGVRPLRFPTWTVEAYLTDVNGVRWRWRDGLLGEVIAQDAS